MSAFKALREMLALGVPRLKRVNGNLVLMAPSGKELLAFDVNDNLIAQVTPRTDTLANLLAVQDAGDGEIATATDQDALVIYKGSPSVGTTYRINHEAGVFTAGLMGSVANNTPTPLAHVAAPTIDTLGVNDLANACVTVPAQSVANYLSVSGHVLWGFSATGQRGVVLQSSGDGGATWVTVTDCADQTLLASALGTPGMYQSFGWDMLKIPAGIVGHRLRLAVNQNSGSTMATVLAVFRARFFHY